MSRKIPVLTAATLILVGLPTGSARADDGVGESAGVPGAPGIGDPYYPLDGNGGYDVAHYDLTSGNKGDCIARACRRHSRKRHRRRPLSPGFR